MIAALIALAAGALHALALADPWTGQAHGWLQGLSLALLVAVLARAARLGIDMPICAAVDAILHRGADLDEAIRALLARPLRREGEQPGKKPAGE